MECIYQYYESWRRIYLDAKPERAQTKAENDRKGKITQGQKAVNNNCVQCTAKARLNYEVCSQEIIDHCASLAV